MSSKSRKAAEASAVAIESVYVSHEEAAKRIAQFTLKVTTKKDARRLLRKAGILNKNNKLVKTLA